MHNNILLYPSLTEELSKKIRFQKKKYEFFYENREGEEHELIDEPAEMSPSICIIKDEKGVWTQDDYNLGFRRSYCLRTYKCLFGPNGIASVNTKLGLAIIWTSADSKQRGVIPICEFGVDAKTLERAGDNTIIDADVEYTFQKAQLRGEVTLSTVVYVAKVGRINEGEEHLANHNGYILGELDSFIIKLDGTGSMFPVFEVMEKGQPLWYVKCDWIDPTIDSFSDYVSINLNKAHKNYKFIDQSQKTFNSQLLVEIIASAISIIVEKVRSESAYWEQILNNESLERGSVGQVIYYFAETLEWDLSSPETVSLCARKFFDQRM